MKSILIAFENSCSDAELQSHHYFRITPTYLPIDGKITLKSAFGTFTKELIFSSDNLEIMECLVKQEYIISIITSQSFTLDISVNGIKIWEEDIVISFKPFIFNIDTGINNNNIFEIEPHVPHYLYGSSIVTVNEYTVIQPIISSSIILRFELNDILPKGLKFDMRNGYFFGIPSEIGVYYLRTKAVNLIGHSDTVILTLNVTENTKYMKCKEDDKIYFEFLFTINDKEFQDNLLLSLYSFEQGKEIYIYSSINITSNNIFGDEICITKSKYLLRLIDTTPVNQGWRNNEVSISINKEEIGKYSLLEYDYMKEITLDYSNKSDNDRKEKKSYCQAIDDLPLTEENKTIIIKCMNNKTEGNMTFYCSNDDDDGNDGKWIQISNYCYDDKPRILNINTIVEIKLGYHYDNFNPITFYGYDVKYTTSNLPKGLTIDIETGIISGTSTYGYNKIIIIVGSNKNGEIEAEIMLKAIMPDFPVIESYESFVNLTCGFDYDNEIIMKVFGNNLVYSIYPSIFLLFINYRFKL